MTLTRDFSSLGLEFLGVFHLASVVYHLRPGRLVSDFRFQISDIRFQVSDFRSRISDFRFQISDAGGTGLLRLGECSAGSRGNVAGRSAVPAL